MSLDAQVLGLAGVFQAVRCALALAREGRCDEDAAEISVRSVFRIDAADAAEVYGGVANLRIGLADMLEQIDGGQRDPSVTRIVATVLHLARKLDRRTAMQDAIREGIHGAERGAAAMGFRHDGVIERLAELYVGTISTLRPRVLVQGNCLYLTQASNVARIRALLLAAIRSAVLWRQSGGSNLKLMMHRRRVADTARTLLASA
jgi:high frequency lysogenization protein